MTGFRLPCFLRFYFTVDVYSKDNKFFLVPVYLKQLADGILPLKAIVSGKEEKDWIPIDENFTFCFSLKLDCYVKITKKSQEKVEGYFGGCNRCTGGIILYSMESKAKKSSGIGIQRLVRFEKYIVGRTGVLQQVSSEPDPRLSVKKKTNNKKNKKYPFNIHSLTEPTAITLN